MGTLVRIADKTGGYVTWEDLAEKFNEETGKNVCAKTVYAKRECSFIRGHLVGDLPKFTACNGSQHGYRQNRPSQSARGL